MIKSEDFHEYRIKHEFSSSVINEEAGVELILNKYKEAKDKAIEEKKKIFSLKCGSKAIKKKV